MKNEKTSTFVICLVVMLAVSGCWSPDVGTKPVAVKSPVPGAVPHDHCRIIVFRIGQIAGAGWVYEITESDIHRGNLLVGQSCTWEHHLDEPIRLELSVPSPSHGTVIVDNPRNGVYFFEVGRTFWHEEINPVPVKKAKTLLSGRFRPENWAQIESRHRKVR